MVTHKICRFLCVTTGLDDEMCVTGGLDSTTLANDAIDLTVCENDFLDVKMYVSDGPIWQCGYTTNSPRPYGDKAAKSSHVNKSIFVDRTTVQTLALANCYGDTVMP